MTMGETAAQKKRRIGVALYFVSTEAEVAELHELSRLAGYPRLASLIMETMDAKREELRERFGPLLAQAQALREAH
jgi:hypothetical protein